MIHLQGREREDWRVLRIYAWYRFVLSLLLIMLFTVKPEAPMIGTSNPPLFFATALAYLTTTISAALFLRQPRTHTPRYSLVLLLADIAAFTLMTHASGGLNTQLSLLYLVSIAAGNILLSGQRGTLIAAVAAISIVYEQFYFSLATDSLSSSALAQSSILGLSFFAVALFSQMLVRRMRDGEALAELRAHDITTLQRLNEQVIRRMRTGIIAVNKDRDILLSNDAAKQLLGLSAPIPSLAPLVNISAPLNINFSAWQQNSLSRAAAFKNTQESPEISATFARLSPDDTDGDVLVFLEDTTQLGHQVQQVKLASLGRLTASIAHEVRNPLGAISHAAQLLAESDAISGADQRLLQIIKQHCTRMNAVIENVLSVSRRQPSSPQFFSLLEWVATFKKDYVEQTPETVHLDMDFSTLALPDTFLHVRFDPEQLQQVVDNLVMNGLRYSKKNTGTASVRLVGAQIELNGLPYLDIIDNGVGITPAQQEHLFEPFYTTESNGTGLGLYLAREICEANQARLDYIPQQSGACFRITFSHPDRLI